ncbi:unnamed protein product, partial [Symbiodinium pilosum]
TTQSRAPAATAVKGPQELYNRLPLATSPSDTFSLPEGATAYVVDDVINSAQEVVTDGFGEMSLDFALQLGLVKQEQVEEGIYHAVQFLGLLTAFAMGDVILAKRVLTERKQMEHTLSLRKFCMKIRLKPTADFATSFNPGIDVVQTTE